MQIKCGKLLPSNEWLIDHPTRRNKPCKILRIINPNAVYLLSLTQGCIATERRTMAIASLVRKRWIITASFILQSVCLSPELPYKLAIILSSSTSLRRARVCGGGGGGGPIHVSLRLSYNGLQTEQTNVVSIIILPHYIRPLITNSQSFPWHVTAMFWVVFYCSHTEMGWRTMQGMLGNKRLNLPVAKLE
jgi:hypothetical protein